MEALTKLKGIGRDVIAWCPGCQAWISDVQIIDGCIPGDKTYVYCETCKEAIIRSD